MDIKFIDRNDLKLINDDKIINQINVSKNYNIYSYNKDIYILKRRHFKDAIVNELFCSLISPYFNLDNAKYMLTRNNDEYALLSKNFKNNKYFYYDMWKVMTFMKFYRYKSNKSLERIESFKTIFSSDEKYSEFIESIINLMAFDFYTHQEDRVQSNIMFMNLKKINEFINLKLAPIYDNEYSFKTLYKNRSHINNPFYDGNITNDAFQELLTRSSKGYETFKLILDINIDKKIKEFKNNYIAMSDETVDKIKRIDLQSKNLVLKI